MDFRYTVRDRWHGEFHLDFCGALMAVGPMGEDYVRGMYHDIEGPTFDATAVATNPKGSGAADPPGSPSSSASISSSCVVAARVQRTMSSAGMPLTGGYDSSRMTVHRQCGCQSVGALGG